MKLEINTRKKTEWKNMSRLNNMLLNNKQIKEEIDNYLETNIFASNQKDVSQ